MPVPRQMTAHTLKHRRGWPSPHAVDFTAKFSASQLAAISGGIAFAGRCVHVNSTGEFEFGCATNQMAMWLIQNSDDPDVSNPGGDPTTVAGAWVAIAPTGKMTALVAKGAYELATTEFNAALTYQTNDQLSAATGTTLATCGVMVNSHSAYPATSICGVCSQGRTPTSAKNAHGVAELKFWPVYLPAHTHA